MNLRWAFQFGVAPAAMLAAMPEAPRSQKLWFAALLRALIEGPSNSQGKRHDH